MSESSESVIAGVKYRPVYMVDSWPEYAQLFIGPAEPGRGATRFDQVREWSEFNYKWVCPVHRNRRWVAPPRRIVRGGASPWLRRCRDCISEAGSVKLLLPRMAKFARFDARRVKAAALRTRSARWGCPRCGRDVSMSLAASRARGVAERSTPPPSELAVDPVLVDDPQRLVRGCRNCRETVADYPLLVRQFVRLSQTDVTDPKLVGCRPSRDVDLKRLVAARLLSSAQAEAVQSKVRPPSGSRRSIGAVLKELTADGTLSAEQAEIVCVDGASAVRRSDTEWRCDACGQPFKMSVLSAVALARTEDQSLVGLLHRPCPQASPRSTRRKRPKARRRAAQERKATQAYAAFDAATVRARRKRQEKAGEKAAQKANKAAERARKAEQERQAAGLVYPSKSPLSTAVGRGLE